MNRFAYGFSLVLLYVAFTLQSAPAQSFKKIKVAGSAPIAQVASGGVSVWALGKNGHPYVFKGKSFAVANNISLSQIAVGGGNLRQPDTVWALDAAGGIYNVVKSGTSYVFNQAPGNLDLIAVGIGYQDSCHPYEVWGLNAATLIYRFNFCIGNWENIPGTLATLSVGGGGIWGVNGIGEVYRFNFGTLVFEERKVSCCTQVTVGPTDAWILDDGTAYDSFNAEMMVPGGLALTQIQAGGDGVWGIGTSQQIYRLDASTQRNDNGGYAFFVQLPGALESISVGSGGGVWGIDGSGQVYAFSTP